MAHFLSWRLRCSLLICTLFTLPALAAQKPKPSALPGPSKGSLASRYEPSKADLDCIVHMLGARTIAQAKARKATCKDSFVLRAYYASLLVQLHAPDADEEIIRNLPQNAAEMDALYPYGSTSYTHPPSSIDAYYRYYDSIFRIATERPWLLPRIFPVAARFGSMNPDNVEEDGWFENELYEIYKKIPEAYMSAVRQTKDEKYRKFALNCRSNPVP